MVSTTYIDLFAGCGGLSLGLHKAGWNGLFAIEKNEHAFQTLHHNLINDLGHFSWPDWLVKGPWEINEVLNNYSAELRSLQGQVDMIAGGPPCQGFSFAGKRREDDNRNKLIQSYLEFVSLVRPKIIFFENVKGFARKFVKNKSKGIAYDNFVTQGLQNLGYEALGKMINFVEFGVPQKRTRFILIGFRKDIVESSGTAPQAFFELLSSQKESFLKSKGLENKFVSLEDAISDLLQANGREPCIERKGFMAGVYGQPNSEFQILMRKKLSSKAPNSHSFANHSRNIVERFSEMLTMYERNKGLNRNVVKEKYKTSKHVIIPLDANDSAPTLTTLPDDFIHYCEPRILTVREYARIQTFPDEFEFKGKYTTGGRARVREVPRYTQIGNAIPPLFAEHVGIILKKLLTNG